MKLIRKIKEKQVLGLVPIIAEIKRYVPAVGKKITKDSRSAGFLAKQYEQGGACGISIVGEKRYFYGQPEKDIPEVLNQTRLPILIKDFISTKEQVLKYKKICLSSMSSIKDRVVILLIANHLKNALKEMVEYCNEMGMRPMIEIKQIRDLKYISILKKGSFIVGFNNKDIDTLEKRNNKTKLNKKLMLVLRKIYKGIVISESGHKTIKDIKKSIKVGADVVLVGTVFMQAEDPLVKVRSFVNLLKREN